VPNDPVSAPVRWGILATGHIAERFTEDLAQLDGAEVVAVGSRSLQAAQAFATRHAIGRAYGSWSELADDSDVDIVYVATPHCAHFEASELCLSAGRAVLCEKPFTLDRASSATLVELASERGLFLMEAMWMRTNPAIRRIVELVGDGAIGEVRHVAADFALAGPIAAGHRLRAPELGGGALLDLGVYPVTFAHLFLGPPDHIRAWGSLFPEGTDESTSVILGYANGASATLYCGLRGQTPGSAVITGTDGRIEVPGRFHCPSAFTLVRGEQASRVEVPYLGNGMCHEAAEVMRCLRAGLLSSPLVPLADTLAVMATLDEARAQVGVQYS
jgi:predicted dehydrogenase